MSLTESLLQGGWAHVKVDPVKLRFIGVLAGDWGISHAAINSSTAMGIWLLDEGDGDTAYDSSGNGNHGKISGAAWAGGMFGSALSFDGADDFVDCGNSEFFAYRHWLNGCLDKHQCG